VAAVDLNRFKWRKEILLGGGAGGAHGLSDPYKPRVFALAPDAGTLYEIDVASLAVSRKAQVGRPRDGHAAGAGNEALWCCATIRRRWSKCRSSRFVPRGASRCRRGPRASS